MGTVGETEGRGLDVNLDWPIDPRGDGPVLASVRQTLSRPNAGTAEPEDAVQAEPERMAGLGDRLARIESAVAALAAHIDALMSTTMSQSNVLASRFSEQAEAVARLEHRVPEDSIRTLQRMAQRMEEATAGSPSTEERLVELQEDVRGLRAAVLEWPELEALAQGMAALRASVEDPRDPAELSRLVQEVAALRASVEDPRDPAELSRLVQEVAALRASVEDPRDPAELSRLVQEVAALRASVEDPRDPAELSRLVQEVAALRASVEDPREPAELAALIGELGELRDELVALRRRVALRAEGSSVALGAEQIHEIAVAVSSVLSARPKSRGRSAR